MAGRLDEGLRSEIKGGIKAWSEYLAGHLGVGGQTAWGGRRRREEVAMVSQQGRKTNLTAQAHLIERRERGGQLGRREPKGKTYFHNYAIDTRASWAGEVEFGPWEERGQRGRLGQRPSGPQGRPGRKQGKRISKFKIRFLNLPRLWKFAQGDLGGILT
jgi:hypothetical protein